MPTFQVTLPCPLCHLENALVCKVVRTGEGLWVSRLEQACPCDVYAVWDEVWWQAKNRMGAQERSAQNDTTQGGHA